MKWTCRRAACAAAALALAAAPALAEKPRARGGAQLVLAMEQAPATVVAEVSNTRELTGSGRAATLRVESSVVGEIAHGAGLTIAWEELAASRASRFRAGDRVLVVLEPLAGASIWLDRLPDASERASTLAVAMQGNAFLRNPAPGEVLLLQHYLALIPSERAGAAGVGYLAQLASGAQLPLAIDAVARLAVRTDLDRSVSESTANDLARALLREDASAELEEALLALVAARRPGALRARLVAMTGGDELAPPIVYAALAEYDEGISPELGARLAEQAPERYRRVAARSASGEGADDVLRSLLRSDPAPSVRASAIERLVELRGEAAIAPVAGALYDPEPGVRVTAARQLGALGENAVPELRRVAEGNDLDAARAAIAGLMWSGAGAGHDALVELAAEHPDDSVRMLADVALGRKTGHGHD
jgi:hypothetical protein